MFKHSSHKIPALNTTSTADISFMLLIFFLVTTSMDRDQGLKRQLPLMDDNKQEQLMDVDRLRAKVAAFVGQEQRRTMHILQVKTDSLATYDAYFRMQNEIVAAYAQLREQRARKVYGRPMRQCSEQQQEALQKYYPQRVAEAYE